jgi:hypothetical protein
MADHPELPAELVESVLDRMADGEILTAICREIGCRPSAFSMRAARNKEFGERYARAREAQAAAIADDVVRIVDEETDPEFSTLAAARSNARKWLASRIDPAKFGDKRQIDFRHINDPAEVDYQQLQAIAQGRLQPPTIDGLATEVEDEK